MSSQEDTLMTSHSNLKVINALNSFYSTTLSHSETSSRKASGCEAKSKINHNQNTSRAQTKKKKSRGHGLVGKRKRQQNRIRKDEVQINVIIQEIKKDPEWTKEKVSDLSAKTGLSESQVYKWNWDQRKKFEYDD